MKKEIRTDYVTRDTIMKLLSDAEIARVSTAETATGLDRGDEYIDLEELSMGVRSALPKVTVPMGRLLPRKAVEAGTWEQIVSVLAEQKAPSGASPKA